MKFSNDIEREDLEYYENYKAQKEGLKIAYMDVGDDTNEICSCGSLFYDTNDTKIALFVLDKLLEKLFCDADKKSDTKIDISYNPELDEITIDENVDNGFMVTKALVGNVHYSNDILDKMINLRLDTYNDYIS